jgi:hypothetical protein
LPNRPAIIVSCHPTKNGDKLIPRGGSSFFNEIDTNLIVAMREGTTVADLHWAEKIRGVDFAPLPFELRRGQSEKLTDAKGRKIWSVTARPIAETTATNLQDVNDRRKMDVLGLLVEDADMSFTAIATRLGWTYSTGEPNKSLAERMVNWLAEERYIEKGPPRRVKPKGCRTHRAIQSHTPPPRSGRPGEAWDDDPEPSTYEVAKELEDTPVLPYPSGAGPAREPTKREVAENLKRMQRGF